MTEKISAEQLYINAMMKKLPDVESKKEYTVKKGDCLWDLAERELNKKNASNQEISNYMLLIAKLNKLNTVEKMNNIKTAQKIYLPDKVSNSKKESVPVKTRVRNEAENTAFKAYNTLKNSKTIVVDEVDLKSKKSCHVYNKKLDKGGYAYSRDLVLSFSVEPDNKISTIYLENDKNLNVYGYDYTVDQKGNIKMRNYPFKQEGKLTPEENSKLRTELYKLIKH